MKVKRRTGVATVIGTLIFVAILMTSVLPMYLTMKEADTMYNQRQAEMVKFDQDRQREQLRVVATPKPDTTNIELKVVNEGGSDVNILRAWINDDMNTTYLPVVVHPFVPVFIGTYTVDPIQLPGSSQVLYSISLTTERGNTFGNEGGPLIYEWNGEVGGWGVDNIIINVLVKSDKNLEVTFNLYKIEDNIKTYVATGSCHVLTGGSEVKPFDVTEYGYNIPDGLDYEIVVKAGNVLYTTKTVHITEGVRLYWVDVYIPKN